MKRQVTLIIALLGILSQAVVAGNTTVAEARTDSVRQALLAFAGAANRFSLANSQEKVYLHFDNTGYYMGETIWYTAYVVNGLLNRPTDLSRVLYVELLSPEGRILERQKLKVENGRASGSLSLANPSKVQVGGFYEVRSYTWAMLNWEGTYYSRVFPVFDNPSEKGAYEPKITLYPRSERFPNHRPKEEKLKKLNVTFYPEGGTMVEGLPSRVAFKAVDEKGQGVSLSGVIYDGAGEKQTVFRSEHGGMGSFSLTPGPGKYEARITYGGREYSYRLPEAEATGYVMRVDNSRSDSLDIRLSRTSRTEGQPIGIAVLCRGLAYEFEEADLQAQDSVRLRISKANLPGGVQQITAYTQAGEVVAERLIYHDDGRRLAIEVSGTKRLYNPFEQVDLQLSVSDESGEPVTTHLSMSVRDPGSGVSSYDRRDIRSELLLGSELRGYIEDIDYYFESDDAEHRTALDLLLMVQGWRRYKWRQLIGKEPFEAKYPVEEGLMVSGQVLRPALSKEQRDVDVTVWVYSDRINVKGETRTDSLGRFTFMTREPIYGENEMSILTERDNRHGKKKATTYNVILDRVYRPASRAYEPTERAIPEEREAYRSPSVIDTISEADIDTLLQAGIPEGAKVHQLPEVEVSRRWWKKFEYRRGIQYDVMEEEEQLIDNQEDYTNDIIDFLMRIDPHFKLKYFDYKYRDVNINNVTPILGFSAQPDVGLIYKTKPAKVMIYQAKIFATLDDIDSIRVAESFDPDILKSYDMERNGGYQTVLYSVDTTYVILYPKPASEQKRGAIGYRKTRLQGYSVPAEFYHVDYSQGVLPDEQDNRRTLYWNPALATDSVGRAQVTFYNNGTTHGLDISAETLTPDGVPGVYR